MSVYSRPPYNKSSVSLPRTTARALWYTAPGEAAVLDSTLPPPKADEILVRTVYSAISRGTERLIFQGGVPEAEFQSMRAPLQAGAFPFPVKYGYCAVGVVEVGPEKILGRHVFVLHPHQDFFIAPMSMAQIIPETLDVARAVLAANMETALNAVWDSGAGPGDRIAVVGGGVVGLLIAYLCAQTPGVEVSLIDPDSSRKAAVESFGCAYRESGPIDNCDIVFHASATSAGLATAMQCCGFEAALVEVSWYGAQTIAAPLGGAFHARRIRLVSSQVGAVSAARRPRWSYGRRLAKALDLLADARLDQLITERIAFTDLPSLLPRLLSERASGVVTLIAYP